MKVIVGRDEAAIIRKMAKRILFLSRESIRKRGRFTLALSGGKTPAGLYRLLGGPAYQRKFSWEKIHFYWTDERWVGPNYPRSNFRLAWKTWLSKVKVPFRSIHRIRTEMKNPEAAARDYEKELARISCLDLVLLGLGEDGHTASLFPSNPAVGEKKRSVVPVYLKGRHEARISVTFPLINRSRHVYYLVTGAKKSGIVRSILCRGPGRSNLPAGKVNPEGELVWFLDRPAASKLQHASMAR